MVTRAYIQAIKPGYAKVRIPILDGYDPASTDYTQNQQLTWATIVSTPGIEANYKPGDVVVISFEDSDTGRPIILGHLKSAEHISADNTNDLPNILAGNIEVPGSIKLSKNISIGSITYEQLQKLEQDEVGLQPIANYSIDSLFSGV